MRLPWSTRRYRAMRIASSMIVAIASLHLTTLGLSATKVRCFVASDVQVFWFSACPSDEMVAAGRLGVARHLAFAYTSRQERDKSPTAERAEAAAHHRPRHRVAVLSSRRYPMLQRNRNRRHPPSITLPQTSAPAWQ